MTRVQLFAAGPAHTRVDTLPVSVPFDAPAVGGTPAPADGRGAAPPKQPMPRMVITTRIGATRRRVVPFQGRRTYDGGHLGSVPALRHSVRLRPHGCGRCRPSAAHAGTSSRRLLVEPQTPDRRRALALDAGLALGAATPRGRNEPSRVSEVLDHLVVAARVAERSPLLLVERVAIERRLDVVEKLVDRRAHVRERDLLFLAGVAASDGDAPGSEVAAADLDTERHALELPLVELEPGPVLGAIVDTDANARCAQLVCDGSAGAHHVGPILVAEDRHDDHLLRRDPRWKPQPAVVAVRHHDAADQSRAGSPRGRVRILLAAVAGRVAGVRGTPRLSLWGPRSTGIARTCSIVSGSTLCGIVGVSATASASVSCAV